jgi:2-polyprenyl-3-methyl-5-hydroxy-6-metoxy-1,4-benzoquinol methylase
MLQTASAPEIAKRSSHPQCPICSDSRTVRFSFVHGRDSIYSCGSCGVEFQFPQPCDTTLAAIYSSAYFLGSKDAEALHNQRALKRRTARLYLDILEPLVRMPNPRLLEIGCGHGEFLLEARARGFQVEGLEYSEHAAAEANSQLGHTAVRVESPEADCLPASTYDLIGAFDVIEHLRDPKRALEYMHAALKPGGVVAIVTPSLDSWSRRLLGRRWMEYKTEHLIYFSRKSLAALLTTADFTNIGFRPNYKTLNLNYVAAHFDRFPVPILTPLMRLLRRALPSVIVNRPVDIVASGLMAIARKRA